MHLWEIFFSALFFENLLTWHAIGLGGIVLFTYTLSESLWVSLRMLFFVLIQTLVLILIRPFFDFPGKEMLLLLALIGTEIIFSVFIDMLLPASHLGDSVSGFIRRGDAILPMVFATIIAKHYNPIESIVFSLGLVGGFIIILLLITSISIKFHFDRLHHRHTYVLKLMILGVMSLACY